MFQFRSEWSYDDFASLLDELSDKVHRFGTILHTVFLKCRVLVGG